MSWRDLLFGFGKVKSTELGTTARGIGVRMEFLEGNEDDEPETSGLEPMLVPPGFFCRPKPPVTAAEALPLSPEGHCEVVACRIGDDMVPIGYRDLRLAPAVNPIEGELGLAHYGGGFLSLKDNADGDGTNVMLYAPRKNAGGTVVKASCISLDSTNGNQHVSLMHETGVSITLTKDGNAVIATADGATSVTVSPTEGVIISAEKVSIAGAAMLGDSNPAGGDGVMLSTQLLAWIGQVNVAMALLAGAAGGMVPAVVAPAAVPVAATKVKAI
jgi:hypothetical protein